MIARAFAIIGLHAIFGAWLTWVFFACYMNLKRVRNAGELTPLAWCFGIIVLLVVAVLDFLLNMTLASILFLEFPQEALFSDRLRRLVDTQPTAWRGRFALWLRRSLLDNFDPAGVHDA